MHIDAVLKAYARYSSVYDLLFGAVLRRGRETVVRQLNCRPGDRILEVGVGTGLSLPLYPPAVRVTGIDISPEMLRIARERVVQHGLSNVVSLEVMDAEQMTFEDNSFDKVVAMYVASVVPSPARLVDEMRRVCKPGGELFILNHFQHANPVIGKMECLAAPLSKVLGFRPDFSLDAFVKETGLRVCDRRPANLFGYWTLLCAGNDKQEESCGMTPREMAAV